AGACDSGSARLDTVVTSTFIRSSMLRFRRSASAVSAPARPPGAASSAAKAIAIQWRWKSRIDAVMVPPRQPTLPFESTGRGGELNAEQRGLRGFADRSGPAIPSPAIADCDQPARARLTHECAAGVIGGDAVAAARAGHLAEQRQDAAIRHAHDREVG